MIDRTLLQERLETAFENFKAAIARHKDVNRKRPDGGWTVGQIANHIVKSTNTQFGATKRVERPHDQHATTIRDLFLNFKMKFPAAPTLQPGLRRYSKEEIFSALDRNKQRVIEMIEKDDLTDTCVDIELPLWGNLTKYEWLVLFENHIIRHTKQVTDFDTQMHS